MALLNFFKSEISFKNKLIITFFMVTFLPAILMQYFTYYNSTHTMTTKINELVNYNLIQTNKNLNTALSGYADILYQVFSDEDVISSVYYILHGNESESLLYASRLRTLLASYTYSKEGIRSLSFFNNNGTIVSFDRATGSSIDTLWNQLKDDSRLNLMQNLKNNQQGSIVTVTEKVGGSEDAGQFVFHIARKLTGLSNGTPEDMGYIIVSLDESVLSDAVNFTTNDTQTGKINSSNFLMDEKRNLISFSDKEKIGLNLSDIIADKQSLKNELPTHAKLLKKASIINYFPNEKTGWTIVNVTNESDLFSEMYDMQKINILAGAASIALTTFLIIYFSGFLTKSVRKIVNAMRLSQRGNFTVQIAHDSSDEFSVIVSNYNKMMITINELMEETRQAVQKQKESEIRSLEAQINPHFLYNTLDSINWMAIEKDEHEISRMLKGLAHILRYSISHSNKLVSLSEEIEWLEHYLFLQQNRFNNSFQYEIIMESGVKRARIYKLLLQPFVENVILHAFSGKKSGGLIKIHFYSGYENSLCVKLNDNGCGMDEAIVKNIMDGHYERVQSTGSGIGVRNVIDRLALYYGDKAKFFMTSTIGEGTEVSLILPSVNEIDVSKGELQ
ncbi:cache domain-containing sensor histidine kinase [Paenibacillus sp. LjRoot153]|uniref:cache domain-containing sensor histidine kinase n=1 Tax=Paenibacillus sp. LjRoot153 TaxID=3342270 RepID=UPI003F4FB68D